VTDIGSLDTAYSLVVMNDGSGKFVVGGFSMGESNYDFTLVRYNADGTLDRTFDGDGKVTTDFRTWDRTTIRHSSWPSNRTGGSSQSAGP